MEGHWLRLCDFFGDTPFDEVYFVPVDVNLIGFSVACMRKGGEQSETKGVIRLVSSGQSNKDFNEGAGSLRRSSTISFCSSKNIKSEAY